MKRLLSFLLISLFLFACGTLSAIPTPSLPAPAASPATDLPPTPTHLPAPSLTPETLPACGNGVCDPNEDATSCTADCGNGADPQLVPFPADSAASKHEFYPLVGQHAQIPCEGCHASGQYQGTPNTCE
ncbi:MAG TPA: hypothetical protein PK530_01295, partial [Anaerolineales bacterium]|nr:hypothetical protein [Anaerolineales bacterium]